MFRKKKNNIKYKFIITGPDRDKKIILKDLLYAFVDILITILTDI